jgi:hypothetical protein
VLRERELFAGLHQASVVIRLPGDLKAEFPELSEAERFDPVGTGKGMKDWWVVPDAISQESDRLASILNLTFLEVKKLPAKEKRRQQGQNAAPAPQERNERKGSPDHSE